MGAAMQDGVSKEIGKYLNSVRDHLRHLSDGERQAVLGNLESHIHEALRRRLGSRPLTSDDVVAVISEMDPPDSFDSEDGLARAPRVSKAYLRSVIILLIMGVLMIYLSIVARFLPLANVVNDLTEGAKSTPRHGHAWLGVAAGIAALLVSLVAVAASAKAVARDRQRRWIWIILLVIGIQLVLAHLGILTFIGPRMADLLRDLGR